MDRYEKLRILADSAKYDVSCSTSGVRRSNGGKIGNTCAAGICHSWSADGRCISLLKVLFTNRCIYDCVYCVNRRTADCVRASFEPRELADLTIEFYRRNYIEGLFLSSAVEVSPDYTAERILQCLSILRYEYEFAGYIHAKIIPGASQELVEQLGFVADRLSVNIELPTEKDLKLLAPQTKADAIFRPMKQITNTLIEHKRLIGPGIMFKGQHLNTEAHYIKGNDFMLEDSSVQKEARLRFLTPVSPEEREMRVKMQREIAAAGGNKETDKINIEKEHEHTASGGIYVLEERNRHKKVFAPAGQTTQMIVGAGNETDRQILKLSESLYRTFKMKRVFFSAYIPVSDSPLLPDKSVAPPLSREHRIYQADWLLRFYGFRADELLNEKHPFLDIEMDPKISWALRHIGRFPVEVNKASFEELLRIPGIGTTSAYRILRQRRVASVRYEDLKKMGVVLKRAKYFLTCSGKYYGLASLDPEEIRRELLENTQEKQLSMFTVPAVQR